MKVCDRIDGQSLSSILLFRLASRSWSAAVRQEIRVGPLLSLHNFASDIRCLCQPVSHHAAMPHLSAEAKHHILLEYAPGVRGSGFKALAARHEIKGGVKSLSEWHHRWDGTPQSLEERPRSGRPRALSSAQVRRHIAAPIRNANRAAQPVSYPALLPRVQAATDSHVSLRTIKRYGKEELQATTKHGKKRTAEERQQQHTRLLPALCLVSEQTAPRLVWVSLPTFSVC
jgi:hypothetical protein